MSDRCPRCHERSIPTNTDPETGESTYHCPEPDCDCRWQTRPDDEDTW